MYVGREPLETSSQWRAPLRADYKLCAYAGGRDRIACEWAGEWYCASGDSELGGRRRADTGRGTSTASAAHPPFR
jgi:hypothetical protein